MLNVQTPSISFIIPAFNEEKYIAKTIEAILKQPPELVKEIIVADNNSADRTAEIAKKYPKVKVVLEKNKGTNWARQTGLKAATGEIIAFIDADNLVIAGWSEKVIKALSNPKISAVSGIYHFSDQNLFFDIIAHYVFPLAVYPLYVLFHYILGIGSVVLGGNLAAKRDRLLAAGGLNTALTFFGDDTDIGKRLRKTGYVKFLPSLVVLSSARRYRKQGFLKTQFKYFINFLWVMFFNRPFSR